MNNKIKTITVTEKHLDKAISMRDSGFICETCVMAQAARRAFKRQAAAVITGDIRVRAGKAGVWSPWDLSAAIWTPIREDLVKAVTLIRLFDLDQRMSVRNMLPMTIRYVRTR